MRGHFWCKFRFCSSRKVWVMWGYGLREVWFKRGSTVHTLLDNTNGHWRLIGVFFLKKI